MKNTKQLFRNVLYVASLMLAIASCKQDKNDDAQPSDDVAIARDQVKVEQTFNDVQSIADDADAENANSAYFKTTQGFTTLSNCATVTRDTIATPHTITIDFGSANCLCNDGRYRRGQILVSYTGRYKDSGSVHTISFNNYFVNDNQVTGTKTVTNMGTNNNGNTYFTITVNGGLVLANNNGTISWTSSRVRTWVHGANTPARNDDVYRITGGATLIRANGATCNINITSPLIVALNCNWIEQGTEDIIPQNRPARTLDYGNGTCDSLATITVNGNTYNVTLP